MKPNVLKSKAATSPRGVVLLHGICNPRWSMRSMERRFQQAGYATFNCHYGSFGRTVEEISEGVATRIQRFRAELPESMPYALVGHSLGGILSRLLVLRKAIPLPERVVMLAPPNRGSFMARRLRPYFHWLLPALDDLSDAEGSLVNRLSLQMPIETGIIAAEPDFVIARECVPLDNHADFMSVPGPHAMVIFRRDAFEQTRHFLENGKFSESSTTASDSPPLGFNGSGLQAVCGDDRQFLRNSG